MQAIGKSPYLMYYGEHEDWLVASATNESGDVYDSVKRSNHRVMIAALNVIDPDGEAHTVETYGGAFGRGEWLLVAPGSECEREVIAMLARIEGYPVLNDDDWTELESEDQYETAVFALQSDSPYCLSESEARAAAQYVIQWAWQSYESGGYGREPIDRGSEWYPSKRAMFGGMLLYRRSLRQMA